MASEKKKQTRHRGKQSSGQFYFVLNKNNNNNPDLSESLRDEDNVDAIEFKGSGSPDKEYRPKPVNRNLVSRIK